MVEARRLKFINLLIHIIYYNIVAYFSTDRGLIGEIKKNNLFCQYYNI